MKLFLAAFVALSFVACGDDGVPKDHPHPGLVDADHDHPDMVPSVHEHPDAIPVGSLESTGYFETEFLLTGNSCDEDFVAEDQVAEVGGQWLIVAIEDEYLFGNDAGFWLSSDDPATTPFTHEVVVAADDWQRQCPDGETYTWEADLAVNSSGFTGTYVKTFQGLDCPVYDSELEEFVPTDFDCTYSWSVLGTRQ